MTITAEKSSSTESAIPRVSWLPMVVIAMAQVLMSFNVSALPVSIGGIVASFGTTPASVSTAIVAYSVSVAAFIMLGAKLGALIGSRRVFQGAVLIFGLAMALMTFSPSASIVITAQAVAGVTAAALVPTLVVLVANHYHGRQQAQALGFLGAAQAMAGVLAFLVAGIIGTWVGWRVPFAVLIVLALAAFILSFRLKPIPRHPGIKIDYVGALFAAVAILLINLGLNNLNSWGVWAANPAAPFSIFGLSPAPVMVIVGLFFGQLFFLWARRRRRNKKAPIIALEVFGSPAERAAVYTMFMIVGIGSAVSFLIPLYIQIVQGRTSLDTSIAVIPYSLSIFAAAILVVRFYNRFTPRTIARIAFILVTIGLIFLATTISNEWSTFAVIFGLILVGLGQGSLVTLLFNVLVTSSPKELAGDVGALRGTTNNLAGGVGTALAGAIVAGLLSMGVMSAINSSPTLTPELTSQVNLDNVHFVSNAGLKDILKETSASSAQIDKAVALNAEARLRALQLSFFVLAGVALLAVLPAGRLPGYKREDLTVDDAQTVLDEPDSND